MRWGKTEMGDFLEELKRGFSHWFAFNSFLFNVWPFYSRPFRDFVLLGLLVAANPSHSFDVSIA